MRDIILSYNRVNHYDAFLFTANMIVNFLFVLTNAGLKIPLSLEKLNSHCPQIP